MLGKGGHSLLGCARPAGMCTACWDVRLSRGHEESGKALHIQLGLSVRSQITERTCGLRLHLDICLVLDNYNQEGDGYAKAGKENEELPATAEGHF